MDLGWRFLLILAVGSLVWILHRYIGIYPPPFPESKHPSREIRQALFFWGIALIVPILNIYLLDPIAEQRLGGGIIRQLFQAPLLTIVFLVLPLIIMSRVNNWTFKDLGITLRTQSRSVTAFAIVVGLASGAIAYVTGQANISIDPLPAAELILLIYTNAIIEEFYHRGVIQSLLERAVGQNMAILVGGVLFGLIHIAFDISVLLDSGIMYVVFAIALQTLAGWMFGIIYMKTRTLWPGIVCHYLANWLPSILVTTLG